MPLHTIPLCSFSYVGDTISSATFKYDTREKVNKNKTKLWYKQSVIEIDKTDTKSFYSDTIKINKEDNLKFNKSDINIAKEHSLTMYKSSLDINKSIEKEVNSFHKNVNKSIDKELNNENIFIDKEKLLALNSNFIDVDMLKDKSLLSVNNTELFKEYSRQLNRDITYKLDNSNKVINLKNINDIKDININSNIELDRAFEKDMDIDFNVNVEIIRQHTLDKTESVYLDRDKEKEIDITLNNKYIYINVTKDIDIKDNIINVTRVDVKKADILTSIYLQREINKEIDRYNGTQLMYKTNNFKLDKYKFISINRNDFKNIFKFNVDLLFYINTLKIISKNITTLGLNRDMIYRINKYNSLALNKDNIKNISKKDILALENDRVIKISENESVSLEDINLKNIYKSELFGLNKAEIEIYNRINMKLIEEGKIDITKNIYNLAYLELVKRWWVLGATEPYDPKILPYDYNYLKKPLSINRRDREYGWLIDQDKHPISFMPYLEGNQGIDLNYGLEEMDLSIEIMLDMINIVGMIVEHSASQFANASGQESIEFIMEVLLDWLNLDTTIKEMNNKGSMEHYLRCYRWIRWEAEKVWFMADEEQIQDRMIGIKYADMLFANLVDYMKQHHFDLVPLWRNLKYMDIERQFNRQAINGDIMKDLDKLKGKRHYYIETQILKEKIFGGR